MVIDHLLLIVKLIIGFSLIVTYLSVTGKTQLSNMTAVDYIGNFVIGGAVGGTIYSGSSLNDFIQYIATLIITLLVVFSISYLVSRFDKAREITLGIPLTVIKDGEFQHQTVNENSGKIDFITVVNKLHLQGVMALDELEYLQIQATGDIVAIKKGDDRPSAIIYDNDKYNTVSLEMENIIQSDIEKIIAENRIKNILFIEYYNKQIIIITDEKRIVFPM